MQNQIYFNLTPKGHGYLVTYVSGNETEQAIGVRYSNRRLEYLVESNLVTYFNEKTATKKPIFDSYLGNMSQILYQEGQLTALLMVLKTALKAITKDGI